MKGRGRTLKWRPTYLDPDGARLIAVARCGPLGALLYLVLCQLDATHEGGWIGSVRALRETLRSLSGCAPRRDTLEACLRKLEEEKILQRERLDYRRTRFTITPGSVTPVTHRVIGHAGDRSGDIGHAGDTSGHAGDLLGHAGDRSSTNPWNGRRGSARTRNAAREGGEAPPTAPSPSSPSGLCSGAVGSPQGLSEKGVAFLNATGTVVPKHVLDQLSAETGRGGTDGSR